MARGWSILVAALLVIAGITAALVRPGGAATAAVCAGVNAPTLGGVTIDDTQNAKFAHYANNRSTNDWTGGDSTYSVDLPGTGGRLWLFSDTYLGAINADGSRPVSSRMPHQTFVRERIFTLDETFYTGWAATTSGVVPEPDTGWYWLRQGTISGSELHLPLSHFANDAEGNLKFLGTDIARFAVANLTKPLEVVTGPAATAVQWGSWVQKDGGYTYIFGTEDLGLTKYPKVARVEGTSLTGPWRYFTGGDWRSSTSWVIDETRAVRLGLGSTGYGVSNEFSVHRVGSRLWTLVTMDTTVGSENGPNFGDDIVAYFACTPVGPFVAKTFLYDTPETGPSDVYRYDPDIYTYNAHSHPEYISPVNPGRLVVSYNVNSRDTRLSPDGDLYRDATIYRPRFIDVLLAGV